LKELRQDEENGMLAFTTIWQSLDTLYKMWADEKRRRKYDTFFGPELMKIDAEQRLVVIKPTTGGPKKVTEATATEEVKA